MIRLKVERLKRGWSQTELAFKSKVAISEISRIETGRLQPYPSQIKRLARALQVDAAVLLEDPPDTDRVPA